jgi:hypothetical protein
LTFLVVSGKLDVPLVKKTSSTEKALWRLLDATRLASFQVYDNGLPSLSAALKFYKCETTEPPPGMSRGWKQSFLGRTVIMTEITLS